VFAADLLPAAGDGEFVGLLSGNAEQARKVFNPAEERPFVVDPAAARSGVVVNAPAIRAHHLEVLLLLLGAQGL
jgi:hypothetical protein